MENLQKMLSKHPHPSTMTATALSVYWSGTMQIIGGDGE
jgi:hypothetical protein